jgi:hypothetical protein
VRKGLIRKAHLAHNLKKWAAKHPDGLLAASVPETHVMEVDDIEYIDEALADVYEVHHYPLHVFPWHFSVRRLCDSCTISAETSHRMGPSHHCIVSI